ncbi:hypothetical protein [Chryseobacterium sp.]|uniref:DMP19 family protein n=1 Tax=Chryseobacterium sp. TaxID=1871047 RepID=UPI0025C6CA0E|nr:hypothetical protein [Chryseobacterium sp.]MBV8326245.1 hypothetical protein [Chryseobacterium sp.]
MKLNKIIVSDNAYNSNDPYDIIRSNISVVNLLAEEGVETENQHEDAVTSYYVDYYLWQYKNGNFSQFVWNSQWSPVVNGMIIKGLTKIGASKHLELFFEQSSKVESLQEGVLQKFLESDYFGSNVTRDQLNNDSFYNLEEDLIVLHSYWLKNHSDVQVLAVDDMFSALEKVVGRTIAR